MFDVQSAALRVVGYHSEADAVAYLNSLSESERSVLGEFVRFNRVWISHEGRIAVLAVIALRDALSMCKQLAARCESLSGGV